MSFFQKGVNTVLGHCVEDVGEQERGLSERRDLHCVSEYNCSVHGSTRLGGEHFPFFIYHIPIFLGNFMWSKLAVMQQL